MASTQNSLPRRFFTILRQETEGLHPRLLFVETLMGVLPPFVGGRLRVRLLRWVGFDIGKATVFWDIPRIICATNPAPRLRFGHSCLLNIGCFFQVDEPVYIGDFVGIGPQTMIITTTHRIGPSTRRCAEQQAMPVTISSGTWIGARSTILPGVTIGPGCVIAAGSVVTRDVPPNTIVGGVPARPLKTLPND
jgi:maltose O-acetyltransferase